MGRRDIYSDCATPMMTRNDGGNDVSTDVGDGRIDGGDGRDVGVAFVHNGGDDGDTTTGNGNGNGSGCDEDDADRAMLGVLGGVRGGRVFSGGESTSGDGGSGGGGGVTPMLYRAAQAQEEAARSKVEDDRNNNFAPAVRPSKVVPSKNPPHSPSRIMVGIRSIQIPTVALIPATPSPARKRAVRKQRKRREEKVCVETEFYKGALCDANVNQENQENQENQKNNKNSENHADPCGAVDRRTPSERTPLERAANRKGTRRPLSASAALRGSSRLHARGEETRKKRPVSASGVGSYSRRGGRQPAAVHTDAGARAGAARSVVIGEVGDSRGKMGRGMGGTRVSTRLKRRPQTAHAAAASPYRRRGGGGELGVTEGLVGKSPRNGRGYGSKRGSSSSSRRPHSAVVYSTTTRKVAGAAATPSHVMAMVGGTGLATHAIWQADPMNPMNPNTGSGGAFQPPPMWAGEVAILPFGAQVAAARHARSVSEYPVHLAVAKYLPWSVYIGDAASWRHTAARGTTGKRWWTLDSDDGSGDGSDDGSDGGGDGGDEHAAGDTRMVEYEKDATKRKRQRNRGDGRRSGGIVDGDGGTAGWDALVLDPAHVRGRGRPTLDLTGW